MAAQVQPYLCFEGRCEEAVVFYESAIGAKLGALMRFSDMPNDANEGCGDGPTPAPAGDKTMHSDLTVGQTQALVSDGMSRGNAQFQGISLSLTLDSTAEVERASKALADGGTVTMPRSKTFFAPCLPWSPSALA